MSFSLNAPAGHWDAGICRHLQISRRPTRAGNSLGPRGCPPTWGPATCCKIRTRQPLCHGAWRRNKPGRFSSHAGSNTQSFHRCRICRITASSHRREALPYFFQTRGRCGIIKVGRHFFSQDPASKKIFAFRKSLSFFCGATCDGQPALITLTWTAVCQRR